MSLPARTRRCREARLKFKAAQGLLRGPYHTSSDFRGAGFRDSGSFVKGECQEDSFVPEERKLFRGART